MYKTIQGQTWDQIAKEVYGVETNAGILMEANPQYLDIFVFPAGIELSTPEVAEENVNLPPWRL